ncbi:MAG: hypothetical protein LBQ16_05275 [Gracilibacteraceae bacterium]|jgi:hypothetical protein|nr:hypothetical protein [Gracilibacteraceae bacterium]
MLKKCLFGAALFFFLAAAGCAAPDTPAAPAAPVPDEPLPVQIMRAAYTQIAEAKSYDLAFTARLRTAAAESDLTVSGVANYFLKPLEARLLLDTELKTGEGATVRAVQEQYIFAADTGLTVYSLQNGRWLKSTLASPELNRALLMDPADDIRLFMDNLQEAEITGEELLDERPTQIITVRVAGEALRELVPEGAETGVFDALTARMFEDAGDLQMTCWVDAESGALVKCRVDLTEFMRKLAGAVGAVAAREGLNDAEADTLRTALGDISAELEYTISNINAAAPFILPAEAGQAEEISAGEAAP